MRLPDHVRTLKVATNMENRYGVVTTMWLHIQSSAGRVAEGMATSARVRLTDGVMRLLDLRNSMVDIHNKTVALCFLNKGNSKVLDLYGDSFLEYDRLFCNLFNQINEIIDRLINETNREE